MPQFSLITDVDRTGTSRVGVRHSDIIAAQSGTWTNYFGRLQSRLGVFAFMTLNTVGKFVVNTLKGSPLMVGNYPVCGWDPVNGLTNGNLDITPNQVGMQQEMCPTSDWSAAFALFQAIRDGSREVDPALVDTLGDQIGQALGVGIRLQALSGGLKAGESAVAGAAPATASMWTKFRDAHVGLYRTLIAQKGNHANFDQDLVTAADIDASGTVTKPFLEIFDALRANAPAALADAVNIGYLAAASGELLRAILLVTPKVYAAAVQAEIDTANDPMVSRRRVRFEDVDGLPVLFVDRVAIVPDDSVSAVDEVTASNTYAAILTVSRVLAIGSDYREQSTVFQSGERAAFVLEQGNSIEDGAKVKARADNLVASAIADASLVSATVDVLTPTAA